MILKRAALMCLVALLAACTSARGLPVVSTGDRYAAASVGEYKLGVDDKVKMTVFNEEGLSGEFTVSAGGTLSLPLIGTVPALGRTVGAVAADAQQKLGDGYLRNPQVAMEVTTYRPFYILGEVTTPGKYPYQIGLTLPAAIAVAQGFTPRADTKTVIIKHEGEGTEQAYRVSPDLRVYPGDTIRVGERFF